MSEQEKATVVIVGATSKQGSSVVCSLLQSGRFTVKALTQDSNSPGAQDLAKRGATLVEGDATTATDLHRAFKGAHAVFAMTFGAPLTEPLEKAVESEFAAVTAALLDPEKYSWQLVPVWDEQLTPTELVATFAKVTGKPAKYVEASKEAWFSRLVPEVASQVTWDGYKYAEELGYYAPERDMQLVRKINPKPFTWAKVLETTGYDGSQSFQEVRNRLWCTSGAPKREE